MSARKSRNHPPLFGVHLNELPQSESGIPLVLELVCRHLQAPAVVQSQDLFSTEASNTDLQKLRRELEESRGSNVDLSRFEATAIAALLVEFFDQLPVPLSAHLSGAFLKALAHQKPALQIGELKAVLRQLPDAHKNVLTYLLRFMIEVAKHENDNGASWQTIAEAFATKLFRQCPREMDDDDDDEDFDEEDGTPDEKEQLLILMLTHHAELEGMTVRGRAARAGVIPEGTLTVGSSPATAMSSVVSVSTSLGSSAGRTASSPDASASKSAAKKSPQSGGSVIAMHSAAGGVGEVVEQLPMLMDEGSAAVRQLTDSNQALSTLLLHLQSHIGADGLSPAKRNDGAMGELSGRLDRCEEAQASAQLMLDAVEERLAAMPSEAEFKHMKTKLADGNSSDGFQKSVQGRLEKLEEEVDRLTEAEEEGGARKGGEVKSEEIARMVKTAVEDAVLRNDRARQEEFKQWRQKAEKDMEEWRKKLEEDIKTEAAVAAANAIKGAIEDSKAATKQVREALDAMGPKDAGSPAGKAPEGGGGPSAAAEDLERVRKELQDANARADNFEERLDDLLKSHDAADEQMQQLTGDAEVLLERFNAIEGKVDKVSKWQEDFVNEPPDLRDVRSKIATLGKSVDELKAAPAAAAAGPACGEAAPSAADLQALQGKLAELEEVTEKRMEAFEEGLSGSRRVHGELQERVEQVEAQVQEVDSKVTAASALVESLRDASMQAVEGMRKIQVQNLERMATPSDAAGSEEIMGTILEHLNPEIASLREAVHSLQQRVGEPAAAEGDDEDEGGGAKREQCGSNLFAQMAQVLAAVGDSPSAANFDALRLQADNTQEQVAELTQKLATVEKKLGSAASPARGAGDALPGAAEMQDRLERVEDDVSSLIGARDASKNAVADAEKRLEAEVRHVDERVAELFEKVEGLVAGVNDGLAGREVVEGLQVEQETLKKNAQHFKTRLDEMKQRSDEAHEKVRALELRFIKEMDERDTELEALQKAVASGSAGGGGEGSSGAPSVSSPASDMTTKLCSKLVEQVKSLEDKLDSSTARQEEVADRSRESSTAIRRLQASVEQLEVHRGAVYVSDIALQKVQDEVRKQGRALEALQHSSSELLVGPRSASSAAASEADSATRLREQLNLLRSEMDAGFIKYNNSLDATARTGARAEALGKSLEALVKQTREEITAEVEQDRQRVAEAEAKARKVGERMKKQLDEALEETRASIEALEAHVADSGSKGNRKLDSVLQPLLERTEALEDEVQRLGEALNEGGGVAGGRSEAEAAVTIVAVRELEGKVSRIEHVQASDAKRISACEGVAAQLQQDVMAGAFRLRAARLGAGGLGLGVGGWGLGVGVEGLGLRAQGTVSLGAGDACCGVGDGSLGLDAPNPAPGSVCDDCVDLVCPCASKRAWCVAWMEISRHLTRPTWLQSTWDARSPPR